MNLKAETSGLAEIMYQLDEMEHMFDLNRHDLGRQLCDITTAAIIVNMDQECDPDGFPWPSLSQWYADWKAGVAPDAPMGVLYGVMKTWEQIAGEQLILENVATMTYGIDAAAKIEAVKFTEGGIVTGTNQPQRPFYGLTLYAVQRCDERFETIFTNFV